MIPESLEKAQAELIEAKRQWCRKQKPLWQQVPWLAVQADGRDGWNDSYSRAYSWGLWTLPTMRNGYYVAFVDCQTGELVTYPEKLRPLDGATVLQLSLESIDAGKVVDDLREAGREPKWPSSAERNDATRRELIIELGLNKRPYQRKRPIKVVEEYF